MHSTFWQSKATHKTLELDRRNWLFLAGMAGALFAAVTPLPF